MEPTKGIGGAKPTTNGAAAKVTTTVVENGNAVGSSSVQGRGAAKTDAVANPEGVTPSIDGQTAQTLNDLTVSKNSQHVRTLEK
ncbi:MAG: hypothetical protein ACON35_05175 [Candidatus Marinamargulisbacteria bacterium]